MLRKVLYAFAAAALILSGGGHQSQSKADTLVVAGWGGPYEAALRQRFLKRFEETYGVKVEWLGASSFLNYGRIQAQRDNPRVDVVLMDDIVMHQAIKDDLIAPLDPGIVTHLGDIEPDARIEGDVGVGMGFNVTSIYYNEKVFSERGFVPIESWSDLFRSELCGRIVIRNITSGYGLYPLLMLGRINGGDESKIDIAFEAMRKLAPCVLDFPVGNSEAAQLTLREDVWVGYTGMSELQALLDQGAPLKFVMPKEGTIAALSMTGVVKGAPNQNLAQQFVNELLSPQGQHDMAVALSWRPTSKKVVINEEISKRLPIDLRQPLKLVPINFEIIGRHREQWTERFAREVVAR